jgi:hypothetical protein
MDVQDYITEGICNGCDQDPAECYNLGYCIYEEEYEDV